MQQEQWWLIPVRLSLFLPLSLLTQLSRDLLENEDVSLDFCFELFAHVTRFFGHKVVLLGLYNGQELDTCQYEVLLRCTMGEIT